MVMYVSTYFADTPVVAYSQVCQREDKVEGNPIWIYVNTIGKIIFNINQLIDQLIGVNHNPLSYFEVVEVSVHEIIHNLGFNSVNYQRLKEDGEPYYKELYDLFKS